MARGRAPYRTYRFESCGGIRGGYAWLEVLGKVRVTKVDDNLRKVSAGNIHLPWKGYFQPHFFQHNKEDTMVTAAFVMSIVSLTGTVGIFGFLMYAVTQ